MSVSRIPSLFSTYTRRLVPVALLGVALLSACSEPGKQIILPVTTPAAVTFTQPGLYPEGVQYDAPNNRFLVSSLTAGAIGQVKDDGTYSVFADNPALVSTIGMKLDEASGRLLVAVSDPGANAQRSTSATQRKLARLAIFSRAAPQTAPVVLDLGALRPGDAGHFANDIAVDKDGNAYITDSFAPVIYKVTPANVVSVFAENTQLFSAPAGAFGLNGIVYHPDGYLLVAKSNTGTLYKVPLATPANVTTVSTTQDLTAADGLLLQDNNTLQVVCNAQAKVYRLTSANGFTSAAVSGTFTTEPQFPTTLTKRGDATYVLYANLNKLFAGQMPPVSQFSINRVDFK